MSARPSHRLVAVLVASAALVGIALPAAAAPAALPDPRDAALDWIEGELAADGGTLDTTFDDGMGGFIPDWGLTIDAVLALSADGRGPEAPASTAAGLVEDNVGSYITGQDFGAPDDRYAGPIAKAMLMAEVVGADSSAFGGVDLEAELRDRLQTTGADAGRFSDASDFGDFSNGFGQALAIMALDRSDGGVPAAAVGFLLDQQCPGGLFRGAYSTSGGCTSDSEGTIDATGFALQALLALNSSCDNTTAVQSAVAALLEGQNDAGAFGGEAGSNTNSSGLAAVALRSLSHTGPADAAAAFIAGLQLEDGDDLGAIALNAAGEASAADGIQTPERDGFRRATTQAVLAFGLPTYSEIGRGPSGWVPIVCDPAPDLPASVTLSALSVVAGGQLTATGKDFAPGETVDATLVAPATALGSATVGDDGGVSLTFTVPADLEPGEYRVALTARPSGESASVAFEVRGVEVPRTLPATGHATAPLTAAGITLLALGTCVVLAARRRTTTP